MTTQNDDCTICAVSGQDHCILHGPDFDPSDA